MIIRPGLRWENAFLRAFEDDRWPEALQIYSERRLSSLSTAAIVATLIRENQDKPTIVFLDVETDPSTGEVWEIGAVRKRGKALLGEFRTFVDIKSDIPGKILGENEQKAYSKAPSHKQAIGTLLEFIGPARYIGGHNIRFDVEHLKDPAISFKALIDTLELAFLVWPTRFSHSLSDLTGKVEVHRALKDALTSAQLFETVIESLQLLNPARQRIVLAACTNGAAAFLASSLKITPPSPDELPKLIDDTLGDQRRNIFERLSPSLVLTQDELSSQINSCIKEKKTCLVSVEGCISIDDQIRSCLVLGQNEQPIQIFASPYDLTRNRAIASRLQGSEHPTPNVLVRSKHMKKICPLRMKAYCHTLSEKSEPERKAFTKLSLWAMDSPECHIDEISYHFRQTNESADSILLELSKHYSDCHPDCGYDRDLSPQTTITDISGVNLNRPIIVPDGHRLENLVTDGNTAEISSEELARILDAGKYAANNEIIEKSGNTLNSLTQAVVNFVTSRNLRAAEDRYRSSVRLLNFYKKSSDYRRICEYVTGLSDLLREMEKLAEEKGSQLFASALSDTRTFLSKINGIPSSEYIEWMTVKRKKNGDDNDQWSYKVAPVDVHAQIQKFADSGMILVTDCACKERTFQFLQERWKLQDLPVVRTKAGKHPPKLLSLTFLPRPGRLNLLSFLTKLSIVAIAVSKVISKSELAVSNRVTLDVIRKILRTAIGNSVIARSYQTSRRRAVARTAHLSTRSDSSFVFVDQTLLLRKKEHKINPNIVLLERLPTQYISDPVTAARFEAAGGGLDAYENFMLPQCAIALNEAISYAGSSSAPLVVCDTRFATGFGSINDFLSVNPTYCENWSSLETNLGTSPEVLESQERSIPQDLASTVERHLREEGVGYSQELSDVDPIVILKALFGHESFREGQEEVVRKVLRREDTFVALPTGFGKSLCYQIPAIAFSLFDEGLTLIVSPLQALMRDQVQSLQKRGILRATYLNSSVTPVERAHRLRGVRNGWYNLLYLAPEQLRNPGTMDAIQSREISLIAIDEAHCLSQWGHDFRPDYMYLADFINQLPLRPVIAGFTATATEQVIQEAKDVLRIKTPPLRISPRRANIRLQTMNASGKNRLDSEQKKKEILLKTINDLGPKKSGIVYCAYTRTTEEIADFLKEHSQELGKHPEEIAFFHGRLDDKVKIDVQDRFIGKTPEARDRPIKIVVATNAFGLGVDKDDIYWVIHYDVPGSLESYCQEVGRSGRDQRIQATGILIFSEFDLDKQRRLFRSLNERDVVAVYEALERMSPSSDGFIYVSESDLVAQTGLDDVTIRVSLYQLEKNGFLKRGPNVIGPQTLKIRESMSHSEIRDSDASTVWQYLSDKLTSTTWTTIRMEELAKDLGWQIRRADIAMRTLLHQKPSPITKQREFECTFSAPSIQEKLEAIYGAQIQIFDQLCREFSDFKDGSWIRIHGETWPRILDGVRLPNNKRLSRIDCTKFFRIWSDINILLHSDELSKDAVKLLVSPNQAIENLRSAMDLDLKVVESIQKRKKRASFDMAELEDLVDDSELIHQSLRRLGNLGLIELSRTSSSSGICMSLMLKRERTCTPKDLDITILKAIQRDRDHKLELMSRYSKLLNSDERWNFIEDYFAGKLERKPRSDILIGLNSQQTEAVTSPNGYLLINAGAGTGKTETVARRFLYVNEELGIPSGQILGMTFSRSGVKQLRERVSKVIPNKRIDIRTYHSFAYEILQTHAGEEPLWIKPGFEIESTEILMGRIRQRLSLLEDNLDEKERIGVYSRAIQKIQSLREPPSPQEPPERYQIEVEKKTLSGKNVKAVYLDYLELMKRVNYIDYAFMISETVNFLRKRPDVLREYQRRIAYIIIDEYQDTTPIQDELLDLLSKWYGNLCVVGDSDQTIFAWSNADIRNILDFSEHHSDVRQINLEINYRSTENVLDVANATIQHNRLRIPKKLVSYRKVAGPRVVIHYADDQDDLGAKYICNEIDRHVSDGITPQDICILTKTNEQLSGMLTELKSHGISASGPEEQFRVVRSPQVKQLILQMEKLGKPTLSAYSCYAEALASLGQDRVPEAFVEMVKEFDENSEDNSCLAFLNFLRATTSQDSPVRTKKNAVNLMTIHRAKGLEFNTVFVTFLKGGSFPRFDVETEEERRVFYVSLTRAKDRLYVIGSSSYPSVFLNEILSAESSVTVSGNEKRVFEPKYSRRRRHEYIR